MSHTHTVYDQKNKNKNKPKMPKLKSNQKIKYIKKT